MRTEEELKSLALMIMTNKVFTSGHLTGQEIENGMLPHVFMPLLFMDSDDPIKEKLSKNEIGLIYADMDDAMPRSINGLPMFMRCSFLTTEETEIVNRYHLKMMSALSATLKEE